MTDNEYIIERLEIFINQKKISIREFESNCGLTRGVIGNATKNKTNIGSDKLAKILAAFPELNMSWLLLAEGEMLNNSEKNPVVTINNGNNNGLNMNQNYVSINDCKKDVEKMGEKIASLEKEIQLKDKIISLLENK